MHQTKNTPPNTEDKAKIESLRLCVEAERHAEQTFVRYCIAAIVTICLIAVGKSRDTITVPLIGHIKKEVLLNNVLFVELFILAIILYGFLGWVIQIIDLNKHELYPSISGKRSLAAVIANKWDQLVPSRWLKSMFLLDASQNVIFFLVLILIIGFLFKVA